MEDAAAGLTVSTADEEFGIVIHGVIVSSL